MKNMPILVIDVDETLLNIEPLFFLKNLRKNYNEYKGKLIQFNGYNKKYWLSPRPRVNEFLRKAKENFNLVAYSIVDKNITIEKLKHAGLHQHFIRVYGEQDLVNGKKSMEIVSKDLNVPLNSIVAIDDIPEMHDDITNVIPVRKWLIGHDESYEHKEKKDNLMGALEIANKRLNESQTAEVLV